MRTVVLLCILLFNISIVSAQVIGPGEKMFGGSLGVNSATHTQNNYENRSSNAAFYPSLSFGVKNNLALGFRGNLHYGRSKITQGVGQQVQTGFSTGLGIYLKKYLPLENRFGIYFDHLVHAAFHEQSIVSDPHTSYSRNWSFGFQFSPGVFYQFSERFLGEANMGGVYANTYDIPGDGYSFSIGASFLQSFNLGINYRFGKRKEEQDQ